MSEGPSDSGQARLPVTIVTGFLGSGKTTLVNHLLATQHGLKIAVMVNEIGEIGIDHDLIISTGEDMLELSNGCICCSINNDLVDAIARVLQRGERLDYLILETTGLADPLPVALTFLRPEFRGQVRLDSIVTTADAANFSLDHFESEPARNQLRYGDIILVNKGDLVGEAALDEVERKIRTIKDEARIIRTTRSEVPLALIMGLGGRGRRRGGARRGGGGACSRRVRCNLMTMVITTAMIIWRMTASLRCPS